MTIKNWQPIETAPISNQTILATYGTKEAVYGFDIVRRVRKGWESTMFGTIYGDGITDVKNYRLLKWMPAPLLHLSDEEEKRVQLQP
jgi:hypothetical protein